MEIGDWITLGAVIVALGIGVASILHTQRLQNKERKERLLNEIIEWAIDIIKCEFGQEFNSSLTEFMFSDKNLNAQQTEEYRAILINLHQRYQSVDVKSNYIQGLAKIFGQEFQSIVVKTDEILDDNIKILRKQIDGEISTGNRDKLWQSLVDNAIKVTQEAAKLKGSGIS